MTKKVQVCVLLALASAFQAFAMTPPMPTHVFYDLLVGKGNVLIVMYTDGVFRTTDGGANWERVLVDGNVPSRIIDTGSTGLLALPREGQGKIYRSMDFGRTWSVVEAPPPRYRCGASFVEMSADGGKTWRRAPDLKALIPELVSVCHNAQILRSPDARRYFYYDGTSTSLHVSKDDGVSWAPQGQLNRTIPTDRLINELYVDSRGVLYANTVKLFPKQLESEERVFASHDTGLSWEPVTFGISESRRPQFSMREIRGNALYFTCRFYGEKSWRKADLCRATDTRSLEQLDVAKLRDTAGGAVIVGPAEELFVFESFDIYRSDDHGRSWRKLGNNGIPGPPSPVAR